MTKRRSNRSWGFWLIVMVLVVLLLHARSCRKRRNSHVPRDCSLILTTGYCNCGKCCGWTRSWFGLFGAPIYNYGPMKGKPKRIGITASGTRARHGTIAADPAIFPFGTRLSVPGYGIGIVEDIGGSIRGRHVDLWFPSHDEAKRWGSRWIRVRKL